jgi:hypothetical protein
MKVVMSKRRLLVALAVFVLSVLLAPLWSGYFGPRAVAYVTTWRPWRSHITLRYERVIPGTSQHATIEAQYRDPWPGQARTPGGQYDFLTLERPQPWLPWIVTERGTGP